MPPRSAGKSPGRTALAGSFLLWDAASLDIAEEWPMTSATTKPATTKPSVPSPSPSADLDPDHDYLIDMAAQRALCGGCSHTQIRRYAAKDPTFPAVVYLGAKPLRWHASLVKWIERQGAKPRPPVAQADNIRRAHARRRAARVEVGHG
jgi:hypothetical protein